MGRFPVSPCEYMAFVGETGFDTDSGKWRRAGFPQTDHHPVVNVNALDAEAYAAWLSERTGYVYRLPSEAECEYSARAGTHTSRFWGDSWDRHVLYAHSGEGTSLVIARHPNLFGLDDMLGNVWHWCADVWHDTYEEAPQDGTAWTATWHEIRRVLPGGSWNDVPLCIRSGYRSR